MDKQSTKGTKLTREGRIGHEKTDDNQDECIITIHQDSNSNSHEAGDNEREWLYLLEKKTWRPANGSSQKPKIQKVHKMLREIESNVRCYDPFVVSIGPFHHGKSKLQPMEKYKEILAIQFADQDSTKEIPEGVVPWLPTNSVSIDELYGKVKDIVPCVRECYADEFLRDYSNGEFAKMMLLDGCFILQFFHCIVTGNYKELKMKKIDIAFIRRDLFLLENQLPFEVLQVLMSCKFKNNEGMEMIKTFILGAHTKAPQRQVSIRNIKDFFGGNLFSLEKGPHLEVSGSSINQLPAHLLELLRTQLINPNAFSEGGYHPRGEGYILYRSATQLRKSGIRFGPGKSCLLSDIEFNSFCCSGFLTLPPITIDDSTKSKLLNLVAYEACPDTPDDLGVTSYICYMDSLIDNAEDVKVLRSKGILLNFLGSDQEVANLFNEIARDLVPNPHAFLDVKAKIEEHYKSKVKVWIAEWMNTHFATPWSFLAFIAASFTIGLQLTDTILSGIQTYYSVQRKDN